MKICIREAFSILNLISIVCTVDSQFVSYGYVNRKSPSQQLKQEFTEVEWVEWSLEDKWFIRGAGGPLLLDKERNVPENWMRRWPRVVAPVQQCCAGRKILLLPDVFFKWIRTRGRWPDDHEEDTCFVPYLQHISHWHRAVESYTWDFLLQVGQHWIVNIAKRLSVMIIVLCFLPLLLATPWKAKFKVWKYWKLSTALSRHSAKGCTDWLWAFAYQEFASIVF